MADAIILILVAAIIVLAFKGSVKHFKGEGACCGGGKTRDKEEKGCSCCHCPGDKESPADRNDEKNRK